MTSREARPVRLTARHAVQYVEQRFGQPQQIAKAVKPEVDEIARQLHHLERELVLVLVGEPHLRDDVIAQVVLHERDRFVEPGPYRFLVAVQLLLDVVTTERARERERYITEPGYLTVITYTRASLTR